ncbi:MAG TPA: glycosyltransferase, partial [Ktedonobacteraceae bacterium]|nr:glycosyltransferase [Ktedonobacteraceae bacterium]
SERDMADVQALRGQGYEVIEVQESRRQAVLRSGLALCSTLPLQVAYARSASFTQTVQRLCLERTYDVIHVEHLRGMASMELLARTHPLVWDAVDCISLLSKFAMKAGPSLSVRAVARLEYKRTQRYEARMLDQLPHVLVTSQNDRDAMIALRRMSLHNSTSSDDELGSGIRVLANGVDLEYFRPAQQERRRFNLVFSGKMSYHANVATALYLYQRVMPLIWQQRPEATLTIVGSNPPKALQALTGDPRVEVTGYVDDLRSYVGRAEIMLSPMVYSVGIQNKVLEAMALGTPVIVAAKAAAALNALPGQDLMVAESAQEFAESALRLMNDAELRTSLGQHGRNYVERHHNWKALTDQLVDVYKRTSVAYTKEKDAIATPPMVLGRAF